LPASEQQPQPLPVRHAIDGPDARHSGGPATRISPNGLATIEFRKILLIKLSALGDVINSVPVLHKLRRRYPCARIDWVLRPAIGELIRHHPAASNVILLDRDAWKGGWTDKWRLLAGLTKLVSELRSTRYDLVIDLQGQLRTAFLALATGAPVRIGFDRPRPEIQARSRRLPPGAFRHGWTGAREGSWVAYSHHIGIATLDAHAVDRYLRIGPMLGLDEDPADFSFPIPADAAARMDDLLLRRGIAGHARESRVLLIAPGTIWETKHWLPARFAEVASHFLGKGWVVLLAGSRRERSVCDEVERGARGAVNLAGETTLPELAALIQRAGLCLTNDSGPMHLAVALKRPVVSIFGPTDAVWIGPYGRLDATLSSDVPCRPCYLRELRKCPHDHACMRGISATAVIERLEGLIRINRSLINSGW
jgi:lipopolysaccharide heptosyltransferase I